MRGKNRLATGFVLWAAMLLCACGREQPDRAEKVYVGVAYYNQSDTFISQMIDCLRWRRTAWRRR